MLELEALEPADLLHPRASDLGLLGQLGERLGVATVHRIRLAAVGQLGGGVAAQSGRKPVTRVGLVLEHLDERLVHERAEGVEYVDVREALVRAHALGASQ